MVSGLGHAPNGDEWPLLRRLDDPPTWQGCLIGVDPHLWREDRLRCEKPSALEVRDGGVVGGILVRDRDRTALDCSHWRQHIKRTAFVLFG
jgi:hypothetical protein